MVQPQKQSVEKPEDDLVDVSIVLMRIVQIITAIAIFVWVCVAFVYTYEGMNVSSYRSSQTWTLSTVGGFSGALIGLLVTFGMAQAIIVFLKVSTKHSRMCDAVTRTAEYLASRPRPPQ